MMLLNKKYFCEFTLLGGEDDIQIGVQICDSISKDEDLRIDNTIGSTSIFDVVRIVDSSDVLICNDTGIMHIGASRLKPVLAIFGSSVREFGFVPYRTKFEICEIELRCRPCSHIGKSKCGRGHFYCMKKLTPDFVLSKFEKLIFGVC